MLPRKLTTASGRVFYITAPGLSAALAMLRAQDDGKKDCREKITEKVVRSEIDDGVRVITMQEGPMKPAKGKTRALGKEGGG